MFLFELIKGKPRIYGEIGYFGLTDWWLSTFTEDERNYIETTSRPLTRKKIDSSSQKASSFLAGLVGSYIEPGEWGLVARILERADKELNSELEKRTISLIDAHDVFFNTIMAAFVHYHRNSAPGALELMVYLCEKQISLAPETAEAFKKEYSEEERLSKYGALLPAHLGFTQISSLKMGQGKYDEVIQISKQAKKQGWRGIWDADIARFERKLQWRKD